MAQRAAAPIFSGYLGSMRTMVMLSRRCCADLVDSDIFEINCESHNFEFIRFQGFEGARFQVKKQAKEASCKNAFVFKKKAKPGRKITII